MLIKFIEWCLVDFSNNNKINNQLVRFCNEKPGYDIEIYIDKIC